MSQAIPDNWQRPDLTETHRHRRKQQRIGEMFASIAKSYDMLNHVLSFNMDKRWRTKTAQIAQLQPGQTILDVCCGTGDLTLALAKEEPGLAKITAVDLCAEMIHIAQRKEHRAVKKHRQVGKNLGSAQIQLPEISWQIADALNLNLPENSFDRITCAFGVRNLVSPNIFFSQGHKLLKKTGKLIILEFAMPQNVGVKWAYRIYFRLVLPLIGSIISSDRTGAYNYLPASVESFATRPSLELAARQAGFVQCKWHSFAAGAVLAMTAAKSAV